VNELTRGLLMTLTSFFIASAAVPRPLHGQLRLETTPHLGFYLPIGVAAEQPGAGGSAVVNARDIGAGVAGLSMALMGSRAGIEIGFGYSPSMVAVTNDGTITDQASSVLLGYARLPLRSALPKKAWSFYVAPGLGVVSHQGKAWDGFRSPTHAAAVLGIGAQLGSNQAGMRARFEVTDYLSWSDFDGGLPRQPSRRPYHALVCTVGVAVPITRR
jgi:hypothetical protein